MWLSVSFSRTSLYREVRRFGCTFVTERSRWPSRCEGTLGRFHQCGNVHLDGYNMIPYLTGEARESPRSSLFYFSDDGDLMAVRLGDWKLCFAVQRALSSNVWAEPFVKLRVPHIFNLRRDPFERAEFNSQVYWKWVMEHIPMLYLCQVVVGEQIQSFAKFPPRQKPASFNLDEVLEKVSKAHAA